jgi:NADH-quinone oxidoreductase subunit L
MWALISTAAAAVVVAGACRYLLARKYLPAAEAAAPSGGIGRILYNKWYFDEVFDRTVVRPILSASRWCWKVVDNVLIDGFVNFVGNFTRLAGWIASLFQTGQATTYAFVLTLGVLAILGAAVFLQ